MKTTCYTLLVALALAANAGADIIAQWNFNSVPPDALNTTGSSVPSTGTGTIAAVGGATQTYSSGNNSSDPTTTDDTAYHTSTYPSQGTGNKTRGIQVNVSTLGFESIIISWDVQQSGSASRYVRFQYSVDGVNFVDHDVFTTDVAVTFINGRSVNLNSITAANNNPNFAFRLVAEFQDTATGTGTSGYVATGGASSYATSGTIRYDMLTVSGSLPDGNAFPTISSIPNQTIVVDNSTPDLPFVVGDAETPADQLLLSGASSNPTLVPPEGIVFGGAESNRTVRVTPNFDETGTTTITITVTDGGGKTASTSFVVTVLPSNTAPTLSTFTNYHSLVSTAFAPINFTISDAQSPPGELTVSVASSNQDLIPDANLVVAGAGSDRTLTITPASGQIGNSVITVTISDSGGLSTTRSFNAMVVPSSAVVFIESFGYPDGSLTTGSGRLWSTRAGTPNQMQVIGGSARVTSTQTEDTIAQLIGGPYNTNGRTVLYASFDVTFSALPAVDPDVFAHFQGLDLNALRARVLASTGHAGPGFYRLGVANNTSTATNVVDYPLDLSLETTYQVVVAYDVAAGTSKLWVNPGAGGGWVSAIDPVSATPINSYGLRQSGGIGDSRFDNLLVGLTFEDVTPNLGRLKIARNGDTVEVSWPSAGLWEGYVLQSTTDLAAPNWQSVQIAPVPIGDRDVVIITEPTGNEFFRLIKN